MQEFILSNHHSLASVFIILLIVVLLFTLILSHLRNWFVGNLNYLCFIEFDIIKFSSWRPSLRDRKKFNNDPLDLAQLEKFQMKQFRLKFYSLA